MRIERKNNIDAFFALVRAGLWEKEERLAKFGAFDFSEVKKLAEEQSVVGLVAAGLGHISDVEVPKSIVLQFIAQTLQLEQRNSAMNHFIADLVAQMYKEDIYTLLVKGQGIAQCYERPLWRACGDVDLFFSKDNYYKAKSFFYSKAVSIVEENKKVLHLGLTIGPWLVELHGSLRSRCLLKMDHLIDIIQDDIFCGRAVRTWMNGNTPIYVPAPNNDVVIIFTHIIKHFFRGGIGLRQICDWCRLLWTYRDTIDQELLEKRIRTYGLLTEWRAFGVFVVNYLGFPIEAMPLYSKDKRWLKKARRINSFVINVGNFGHNRDLSYYSNRSFLTRKAISLWRHTKDSINHVLIFPIDSIRVWVGIIQKGAFAVLKGK